MENNKDIIDAVDADETVELVEKEHNLIEVMNRSTSTIYK